MATINHQKSNVFFISIPCSWARKHLEKGGAILEFSKNHFKTKLTEFIATTGESPCVLTYDIWEKEFTLADYFQPEHETILCSAVDEFIACISKIRENQA
ncbi:hypothetical protein ACFBZI_11630 [Moraxella sp. ZJ142]|uniref:hypothetical protein n=1 Tax=Moraxella marmotae TaxID=3344520 RepID=UPI0035D4D517